MSNDYLSLDQVQAEIDQLMRMRQQLRADERGLQRRQQLLLNQPQVNKTDLRGSLREFLPERLMPGNVGGFNCVVWPFWQTVDFDFGDDPVITGGNVTQQQQDFQVTQEAAILLTKIVRSADEYNTGGDLGPWQITIRDNQSSRQFNDAPIPIQMISNQPGLPTILDTPMLMMPNARVSVVMSNWLPQGTQQQLVGSTKQQFSFFGYRIRIEDTEKVLSSVFDPRAS